MRSEPKAGGRARTSLRWVGLLSVLLAAASGAVWADEEGTPDEQPVASEETEGATEEAPPPLLPSEVAPGVPLETRTTAPRSVIGVDPDDAFLRIPGSGESRSLDAQNKKYETLSLQDATRSMPGVVIRPEVGSGIIPNIGIRGLSPDRSEKMLILEDGIPAGLAPYIENASYYIPPIERMERIELLKGSGSILHGPHTVGGVLNLITPRIPDCDCRVHGRLKTVVGSDGYRLGFAQAGQTVGRFGYLLQVMGKRGDGWRDEAEFDLLDLMGKFRYQFNSCTSLTLKLNTYRSESQDTYLGLTQGMYEQDAYQNPVRNDELEVEWTSAHAMLEHRLSRCWDLVTSAYWSEAERNWNRQDFARNTAFDPAPANTIETVGDTAIDGGAIYLRESYGARDREFKKFGIESRLMGEQTIFGRRADMQLGVRYHVEEMIDRRNNRAFLQADPVTRNHDVRTVDALAAFGQVRVDVLPRLTVSAGLRMELYEQARHQKILNNAPVDNKGSQTNVEWIPGAGFTYRCSRAATVYGGVHRGFSPPRTAQAITSSGDDVDLDAERSWNWELGVRGRALRWLDYDVTGFYYDFRNQIVPDNQSGGASTAIVNAGETRHLGIEASVTADLLGATLCRPSNVCRGLHLDLSYTFVETENTTNGGLFEGNELPYAPRHVLYGALRAQLGGRWDLSLSAQYMAEQFTDQANTAAPSADGTIGKIDSRFLVDFKAAYRLPRTGLTVTASAANLFDETYIASRAPQGIFPGKPRHFFLGLEVEF